MYFNNIHLHLPEMPGPPHHHPSQRLPPPGMGADHPPWGGSQHPEFSQPPHGFNGHSPQMRHRQQPVQDDPSLVPNVPYFDLPAGLMAPLVKVRHHLLIRAVVLKSVGPAPIVIMLGFVIFFNVFFTLEHETNVLMVFIQADSLKVYRMEILDNDREEQTTLLRRTRKRVQLQDKRRKPS